MVEFFKIIKKSYSNISAYKKHINDKCNIILENPINLQIETFLADMRKIKGSLFIFMGFFLVFVVLSLKHPIYFVILSIHTILFIFYIKNKFIFYYLLYLWKTRGYLKYDKKRKVLKFMAISNYKIIENEVPITNLMQIKFFPYEKLIILKTKNNIEYNLMSFGIEEEFEDFVEMLRKKRYHIKTERKEEISKMIENIPLQNREYIIDICNPYIQIFRNKNKWVSMFLFSYFPLLHIQFFIIEILLFINIILSSLIDIFLILSFFIYFGFLAFAILDSYLNTEYKLKKHTVVITNKKIILFDNKRKSDMRINYFDLILIFPIMGKILFINKNNFKFRAKIPLFDIHLIDFSRFIEYKKKGLLSANIYVVSKLRKQPSRLRKISFYKKLKWLIEYDEKQKKGDK